MRLKFYLIGMGIGVIVTVLIMGILFRGRTREMTDEEIIARARQLGMVEAGRLTEHSGEAAQVNTEGIQSAQQVEPLASTQETSAESGVSGTLVIAGEPDEAGKGEEGQEEGPAEGDAAGAGAAASSGAGSASGSAASSERDSSGTGAGASEGTVGSGNITASLQNTGAGASSGAASSASAGGAASSANAASSAEERPQTGSIVVTIPDGVNSEEICELLQNAGVIDSAAAFNDFLVQSGRDRYIGVGARLIPRGATYEDVSRIITGG